VDVFATWALLSSPIVNPPRKRVNSTEGYPGWADAGESLQGTQLTLRLPRQPPAIR
jgi:hypothetical protein